MRASQAVRRVLCLLPFVAVVAGGCASTASSTPPAPVIPAAGEPVVGDRAEPEAFEWPRSGWLRLDLDGHMVFDRDVTVASRITLFATWTPGRLEMWIDAPDALAPERRQVIHELEVGDAADAGQSGLRGQFEAGRAEGVRRESVAGDGTHVFAATDREHGVTVTQRWEIGSGAAPWGADGPPGLGS